MARSEDPYINFFSVFDLGMARDANEEEEDGATTAK
jgi:hypothetical protein